MNRYRPIRQIVSAVAVCVTLSAYSGSAARPVLPDKESKKVSITKCDKANFRVVVDVGHTLEAHGAMSARNVPEYEFNFRLAQEIQQSLIADGFAKSVLLVTHGPARKSLIERVMVANHLSADLFLSIHHDSVPDSMLEEWQYDGKPSYFSDRFKGHSLFVSYENPHLNSSIRFATLLGGELKNRGLQYARQYTEEFMGRYRRELVDAAVGVYRYDQLAVLRETQMPAVLLEAGSIINRDEEMQMNSPDHRTLISAAVIKAATAFCSEQS